MQDKIKNTQKSFYFVKLDRNDLLRISCSTEICWTERIIYFDKYYFMSEYNIRFGTT